MLQRMPGMSTKVGVLQWESHVFGDVRERSGQSRTGEVREDYDGQREMLRSIMWALAKGSKDKSMAWVPVSQDRSLPWG